MRNKNIRPFAGTSLLEIKIKQMLRIKGLDGVVVNSDSDEMLDIANSLGVETFKRDSYYATSTVSINEVYKNIAENKIIHFLEQTFMFALHLYNFYFTLSTFKIYL